MMHLQDSYASSLVIVWYQVPNKGGDLYGQGFLRVHLHHERSAVNNERILLRVLIKL